LVKLLLPPVPDASSTQSGPFALKREGNELVSYDDVESVRRKAEYVKAEGLAGASLSTLDLDDFNNLCCQVQRFKGKRLNLTMKMTILKIVFIAIILKGAQAGHIRPLFF